MVDRSVVGDVERLGGVAANARNNQLLGAEALAKEAHVRRSSPERRRISYQLAARVVRPPTQPRASAVWFPAHRRRRCSG